MEGNIYLTLYVRGRTVSSIEKHRNVCCEVERSVSNVFVPASSCLEEHRTKRCETLVCYRQWWIERTPRPGCTRSVRGSATLENAPCARSGWMLRFFHYKTHQSSSGGRQVENSTVARGMHLSFSIFSRERHERDRLNSLKWITASINYCPTSQGNLLENLTIY